MLYSVHCSSQQLPRVIFTMMDKFRNLPSYLDLDKFSISRIAIVISLRIPLNGLEIEQEEAQIQLQMKQQMTPPITGKVTHTLSHSKLA